MYIGLITAIIIMKTIRYVLFISTLLWGLSCRSKQEDEPKEPEIPVVVTPPEEPITPPKEPEEPVTPPEESPVVYVENAWIYNSSTDHCEEYMICIAPKGKDIKLVMPDSLPDEFKLPGFNVTVKYRLTGEKYHCEFDDLLSFSDVPVAHIIEIEEQKVPEYPPEDIPKYPEYIPSSTDQIADIFLLKYGEVKEWHYNGRIFKLTITDIDDRALPCESAEFEFVKGFIVHAFLRVETDTKTIELKVTSPICGGWHWNDSVTSGSETIQSIWEWFESAQSSPAQQKGFPYFQQEFYRFLHEESAGGTLLETPSLYIYLAGRSPRRTFESDESFFIEKNRYTLIFLITDLNRQNNENR